MAGSILKKYTDMLNEQGIEALTKRSQQWFIDMMNSGELNVQPSQILRDQMVKVKQKPLLGRMYMFKYDPKLKRQLPYYDRFPLIVIADFPETGDGFYGLNFHYLNPIQRINFFQTLYDSFSSTGEDLKENTRLKLSYNLLKSMTKLKAFKPTFKRYLPKHIKSSAVEIPSPFWEVSIFLPTYKFIKSNASRVWTDSKRIAR